ncbi:UPF0389 protein CG9231 [Monomorium pharaonis]|uniref:UPF0389 protein CG9231 n=1 Tax=Monomorium pharaonis TaxID=307658 RepID=UPI00063F3759|nr:UPF0389 protein CG9231 [Monomorium pharaonis]XP_036139189.1 UPF0389 protein CG9231 [Monomorium pharaonis]
MLLRQFVRSAHLNITTRCFTRSNVIREINNVDKTPAQKSNETVKDTTGVIGSRMYPVTNFDKRILVWVKRYPSVADVPNNVTEDCMLAARSKARIKTCHYMIVITLIGCLGAAILGKRAAASGDSLFKQREEWLQQRLKEDKNK